MFLLTSISTLTKHYNKYLMVTTPIILIFIGEKHYHH